MITNTALGFISEIGLSGRSPAAGLIGRFEALGLTAAQGLLAHGIILNNYGAYGTCRAGVLALSTPIR
jgi:hypothetical protein